MEPIILTVIGVTVVAIIIGRIRRALQEITRGSQEKCDACGHCYDCCLEKGARDVIKDKGCDKRMNC